VGFFGKKKPFKYLVVDYYFFGLHSVKILALKQILWGPWVGNRLQEDLAKIGYRSEERTLEKNYMPAMLLSEYGNFSFISFKIWQFGALFSPKYLL